MFPTKDYFDASISILESLSMLTNEKSKKLVAEQYAKETFIEYDNMTKDEKKDVIKMVMEDLEKDLLNIN